MSGSPSFKLSSLSRVATRVASVLGLTFVVACGGGGGSGGCGGSGGGLAKIKGGYPVDKRVENAISIRAAKPLFDFLEANAKTLLGPLLPAGGIPVPSTCTGDTQICCGQMCTVGFDFQSLKFDPQPPQKTQVTLRAKLKTSTDFNVKAKAGIFNVNCKLALDTGKSGKPDIGITLGLLTKADMATKLTTLNFDTNSVDILDLDNNDIDIKGDILCGTINLLKGLFIGQLKDQLKKQLAGPLDTALCQSCTTKDDCSSLANQGCSMDKRCMRDNVCMQQLGVEGRIDLSGLLGGFGGSRTAAMDIYATVGGYAEVETAPTAGMSLGMLGGAVAPVKSTCVPTRPAPTPLSSLKKTAAYAGNTTPSGKPYHIGAGISTLELDTLGHAFYESGGLCLSIGTSQVELLSSGLLAALIPSLNDLTRGSNSALKIVIRPQQPPTFVLGKGTFKTDGMGKRTIDDPMMHLSVKDLALDFYVYSDDRFVRFMRQTADLDLPISLDVDAMNQIVPMIGELDNAFGNVRVTESALLKESPTQLARLFPSLLPVISGQLSGISPIKLPSLMGLDLVPTQITTTLDGGGKLSYLGLFLTLKAAMMPLAGETVATPVSPVETFADLVSLDVPTAEEMSLAVAQPRTPRVVVAQNADSRDGGIVEYQWRLDGGFWHAFDHQRYLTVEDAALRLPGSHSIEVRGRIEGRPETLDPVPAKVEFLVAPSSTGQPAAAGSVNNNVDTKVDTKVDMKWKNSLGYGCSQSRGETRGVAGTLLLLVSVMGLLWRRRLGTLRAALTVALVAGLGLSMTACKSDVPVDDGLGDAGTGEDMSEDVGKPRPEFSDTDEIGRYQSAIVAGGKLLIAAYNASFGDLAFTETKDPTGKLLWFPVDGLPSGDPENTDKKATRGGYVDVGDDVGKWTAMAISSKGSPVIAYQDVTASAVKLAVRDGDKWTLSNVTDISEGRGIGAYTQLVLDDNNIPTLAYMVAGSTIPMGMGKVAAQLVVARAKSATPSKPSDWTKTVVESVQVPCSGLCAKGEACVYIDPAKKDKLATVCKPVEKTCSPSCKSSQACLAAKCVDALGTPPANLPEGTGLFARLLADKSGAQLLFYNHTTGALKLASGADWKVTTLEGGDGMLDTGRYIGATLGTDGTLHMTFSNADSQLWYRSWKAGTMTKSELVDDGNRAVMMTTESHSVGAGAVIFLDAGLPAVAYQDSTAGTLELARRDAMGKWTHKTAAGAPGKSRGYFPQAIKWNEKWWLLDVVYDRAAPALSGIQFTAL